MATPGLALVPDAAAVTYTSGSTGRPKGIVRDHRGVLHTVMHLTNPCRSGRHDRLLVSRASLRNILYALCNGAAAYPVTLGQGGAGPDGRLAESGRHHDFPGRRIGLSRLRRSRHRSGAVSTSCVSADTPPAGEVVVVIGEEKLLFQGKCDTGPSRGVRRWRSPMPSESTPLGAFVALK